MNNPLLEPFDQAPFSKIENEHFKPAFLQAMDDARKEINDIVGNPEPPTFKNTLEALDFAGQQLDARTAPQEESRQHKSKPMGT